MTAIIFTKWHVYMITAVSLSESVSHYELEQAAHFTLCKHTYTFMNTDMYKHDSKDSFTI